MWFMQQRHRPSPTMPAPAPTTTCTCSGWWRSATCGAASPRRRGASAGNGAAEPMKTQADPGRYFMDRMLPETAARLARVTAGAESLMALPAEAF